MNINRKEESIKPMTRRSDLIIGLGVGLSAFIVRLFYTVSYLQIVPDARQPANDAKMYWDLGRKIYLEGWLLPDHLPFYQAPFYPYVLAMLHHLGIHTVEQVIHLQVVLGVLNSILCYCVARCFINRFSAGLSALLFSFSHLPIFFESKILPTTLGIFLFLLFICLFVVWLERRGNFCLFLSSGLYGLLVISLPHFLFLLPYLFLFFFLDSQKLDSLPRITQLKTNYIWLRPLLSLRIHSSGWLFLLGFSLVLSPVTLRNRLIGGDWTLICANSGVTLYMGTNDHAEGGLGPVEGLSNEIERQHTESIELASKLAGKTLNPAQASTFWIIKTMNWIFSHPGRFLILEGKKFLWTFNLTPPAVNYSFHFESIWIARLSLLQIFTGISLIGALGAFPEFKVWRNQKERLLICLVAGYLVLSLVYYASDRFLAAHIPVLAIMAGYVFQNFFKVKIQNILDYVRENPLRLWGGIVRLLLAGLITFNPFFSWKANSEIGWGWYNLGVFYERSEQPDEAMQSYKTAMEYISNAPSLLINLGVLYAKQDNLADSTRLFERTLQLEPANRTALQNLLINYRRLGRYEEAETLQKLFNDAHE